MNELETVDYDDIAEGVRRFAAERLYELEKSLRPLVDGTFGEVLPGHLSGYLSALKELGRLYQTHQPPRALQDLVPMSKVQAIIAGMEEEHARALEQAVVVAEARVRAEVSSGAKLSINAAKATVVTRLLELESRAG